MFNIDAAHKTDLVKIEGNLWRIRPAIPQDAPALFTYLKSLAFEPVNNTRFSKNLMPQNILELHDEIIRLRHKTNATIYVAVAGETIVGVVYCHNEAHVFNQNSVNISVHVHSEYRGMGISSNLLSAAVQWAIIQPEINRVELEVPARNTKAITLYERIGFKYEATLVKAYRPSDKNPQAYEDAILMALYL